MTGFVLGAVIVGAIALVLDVRRRRREALPVHWSARLGSYVITSTKPLSQAEADALLRLWRGVDS